jgi:hypothetical protein
MKTNKAKLIILVAAFLIWTQGCGQSTLTKKQIINIATKEAKAENITLDIREVYYDLGNSTWARKLVEIKKNSPDYAKSRNYFKILDGYNYQAVLFALKPDLNVLGGDFWVFVDKKTGQVITIHGEE